MNNPNAIKISDKMSLRKEMLARRAVIARDFEMSEAKSLNRYIREYVLDSGVKDVAGYMHIGSECDINQSLEELHEYGISLSLPVVVSRNAALAFRSWKPGDILQRGTYGISQPPESSRIVVPELILVPLLAFDGRGFRLGYGGGYYDRTLHDMKNMNAKVQTLGVAFSGQRVDFIEDDKNDVPLDAVATEKSVERFSCAY